MTGLLVADRALIGGDSLFADSVARPDLESGDLGVVMAVKALGRDPDEWSRVLLSVAGAVEHRSHFHGGVHDTTRHCTPPTCATSWWHWP